MGSKGAKIRAAATSSDHPATVMQPTSLVPQLNDRPECSLNIIRCCRRKDEHHYIPGPDRSGDVSGFLRTDGRYVSTRHDRKVEDQARDPVFRITLHRANRIPECRYSSRHLIGCEV